MPYFEMEGDIYENPFAVKHTDGKVTSYKFGYEDWKPFTGYGADHYPTTAWPLLLEKAQPKFSYFPVVEGTGEAQEETTLKRKGDMIYETREGKTVRSFKMKDGIPIEIYWGGPRSVLKANLAEAKAGSPIEHEGE